MKALLFGGDHTCCEVALGGAGTTTLQICAAVGATTAPRVRNLPADVRAIQAALNRFPPLEGGPNPPLEVDGICGRHTRGAIEHFQKKWALTPRWTKVPDGIVDPKGPTIDRLSTGPGRVPTGVPEFFARIPEVMRIVTAAGAAIDAAIAHLRLGSIPGRLPGLVELGELAVDRADRHFHIRRTRAPIAQLEAIRRVYLGMQTAIGHVPQGLILAVDEPADVAVGAYFFTARGGYHLRDPSLRFTGTNLPVGSIYVCPKGRALTTIGFAYGMIHELAHFVGPAGPAGIGDQGYFHKGTIARLSPLEAIRNADSYAQFAFDAIGKRDFNATNHHWRPSAGP